MTGTVRVNPLFSSVSWELLLTCEYIPSFLLSINTVYSSKNSLLAITTAWWNLHHSLLYAFFYPLVWKYPSIYWDIQRYFTYQTSTVCLHPTDKLQKIVLPVIKVTGRDGDSHVNGCRFESQLYQLSCEGCIWKISIVPCSKRCACEFLHKSRQLKKWQCEKAKHDK